MKNSLLLNLLVAALCLGAIIRSAHSAELDAY
jgi:hypothetical protein